MRNFPFRKTQTTFFVMRIKIVLLLVCTALTFITSIMTLSGWDSKAISFKLMFIAITIVYIISFTNLLLNIFDREKKKA